MPKPCARRRVPVCCAITLAALGLARPAAAYEDQTTVGLGLGYAHAFFDRVPRHGVLAQLSASVGLGQALSARGLLGYALHPDEAALHVGVAGAELVYLVDVIELVPWCAVGADGVLRVRGDDARPDVAAHVALGLDYLLSRELTLTLEARPYLLLTDLDRAPVYGAVTVSASWMMDN